VDAIIVIVADSVAGNSVIAGIVEVDAVPAVIAYFVVCDCTVFCVPEFYPNACIG
jgi:hypothetical protein